MTFFEAVLLTIITASTPLVIAAIGELVTERAGVLNLGVEGMVVIGSVSAFAAAQLSGSAYIGLLAGIAGGAFFSLLFSFLTLTLVANQVATGLALTIMGLGASGMIGESYVSVPGIRLLPIEIPLLSQIPTSAPCCSSRTSSFTYPSCSSSPSTGSCSAAGRGLNSEPSATATDRPMPSAFLSSGRAIWP